MPFSRGEVEKRERLERDGSRARLVCMRTMFGQQWADCLHFAFQAFVRSWISWK